MATKKAGKTKVWFKIYSPKIFNEIELGEIMGSEGGEGLVGKTINTSLSEVMGDITRSNVKISLKINKIEGDRAFTEVISHEVSKPFLMRMIRRRISKVDYVEAFTLSDGKRVKLKSLIITAYKADTGQKTALRRMLKSELTRIVPTLDFNNLVVSISTNKLQKEIGQNLKKVYPIRFFEIRKMEIVKEKRKD